MSPCNLLMHHALNATDSCFHMRVQSSAMHTNCCREWRSVTHACGDEPTEDSFADGVVCECGRGGQSLRVNS